MAEIDAAAGMDNRGRNHELWLAMQGSYNRYKTASAALDALTATSRDTVGGSERDFHIEAAATIERTAFENYIEARLQLSECLLSKPNAEPMEAGGSEPRPGGSTSGRIIVAVVAALLFPAACGLGYLVHEHLQSSDRQAATNESSVMLNQTRKQLEALADQVEVLKADKRGTARSTGARPLKSGGLRKASARNRANGWTGSLRSHQKVVIQAQRRRQRHYLVMPPKLSERSGPIRG